MKLRTAAIWALFGMIGTSAGAMAIPATAPSRDVRDTTTLTAGGARAEVSSHFTAGRTLTIDGRLGHASIAKGGSGETFLYASVAGGDAPGIVAPPVNLAIVIDRSGSMKGDRIANAIAAATGIVDRMRDGDSVTVVSFDTEARVVVPATLTTASSRPGIDAAIRAIRLGGDTCISCGLDEAMSAMSRTALGGDRVNRMILLSDGAANHGTRDVSGLRALAARMRDRGCSISTIGVDVDFDEKVMAAIALESNGRHYFVANASGLPAVFDQELESLLATVARDSELAVELAPGVEVDEVFDRTFRREGSRVVVPFGTFGARQEKTVLMRLRVPSDREGVQPVASVSLRYRDQLTRGEGTCDGDLAVLVTNDGTAQRDLDPFVAARLARSRTAQTLTEANLLFERGRVGEARARLAQQQTELAKTEVLARASAKAFPAKPSAARPFDRDLEEQRAAVATAEASFAAPPPAAGAAFGSGNAAPTTSTPGAAPQPIEATREGKAAVRQNQTKASDMAF
jgi:Ca-activated chloride channel family protein